MIQFERDKFGFWKQVAPAPFVYTEEYKSRQSTNESMSFLRLGWLAAHLEFSKMKDMRVVDIGCGNGEFVRHAKKFFSSAVGYDVAGASISERELKNTEWDLVVLSDVLEHFANIDDLFDLKWKFAFVSFPETPSVSSWEELEKAKFRHFKPDEHLWMMNTRGFREWADSMGAEIVAEDCFEDAIRTRWEANTRNISSFLLKRSPSSYK